MALLIVQDDERAAPQHLFQASHQPQGNLSTRFCDVHQCSRQYQGRLLALDVASTDKQSSLSELG